MIITNNLSQLLEKYPFAQGFLHLQGAFRHNFQRAIQHIYKPRTLGSVIEDINENALKETLYSLYKPVDAGGGVVLNEEGAVLMIYRRGKWDLPKGKTDKGESIADSALREVEEETGAKNLALGNKIWKTYHLYSQDGKDLLKRTSWYKMYAKGDQELVPQALENILKVEWIPQAEINGLMRLSYQAIKETLIQANVIK